MHCPRLPSCFVAILALLTASTGLAATYTIENVVSDNALSDLRVGDTVTFDIRIENPDELEIWGIGARVFGWDPSIVAVTAVETVDDVFNSSLVSLPGGGREDIGGIANVVPGLQSAPGGLDDFLPGTNVSFMQAITLTPTSATGALDIGLDGDLIRDGGVHSRVTLQVLAAGETEIHAGTSLSNADVVIYNDGERFVNIEESFDTLRLRVGRATEPIPEPGAALLFGVGLAVVGAMRRP